VVIKHRIGEIYTHWPFYGSRRITVKLNQEEIPVSRLTVQRYMREMGISGIAPGPNTCKLAPEHKIYPYLLRQVSAQYPNHVWGIDITYIRPVGGWMYLVAILDLVLSLRDCLGTGPNPRAVLCPDRCGSRPLTGDAIHWNSDQGSHFISPLYLKCLSAAGIQISMDSCGRAADNIFTERLWHMVKYKDAYLND